MDQKLRNHQANTEGILVSVACIAFNHQPYIRRCIEGFLSQKTSFQYEVLIHDDASTDGTAEIIREYAAKYPNIVKPICQIENQFSRGGMINIRFNFPRAKGRYIALCEGDDEWIDPYKLQQQVDILEQNDDIVLCYANAQVHDTKNPASNIYFDKQKPKQILNRYEILQDCVIPTCTVVFRNVIKELPGWFVQAKASAYFLFYLLSKYGKFYYLDKPVALYNHHYNGMSRKTNLDDMLFGDALLRYQVAAYFEGDSEILAIASRENAFFIDNLFHRGTFRYARRLFWKQPFAFFQYNSLLTIVKLFLKVNVFPFLSKREKHNVY